MSERIRLKLYKIHPFLKHLANRCENVILQWEFIFGDRRTKTISIKEHNQVISDQQRRKQGTYKFLKQLCGKYTISMCVRVHTYVCVCFSVLCLHFIQQFKRTLISWQLLEFIVHHEAEMLSLEPLPLLLFNNVAVELHSSYTNLCEVKKKEKNNKDKPFCIHSTKGTVYWTASIHNVTLEFWYEVNPKKGVFPGTHFLLAYHLKPFERFHRD